MLYNVVKKRTLYCKVDRREDDGNSIRGSGYYQKLLKEINGWGKTIIMVTHDPQMASNCKKVILLKDGVILKTLEGKGDSEEERERYYREILGEMEQL